MAGTPLAQPPEMGFPIHYAGRVVDDPRLRLLHDAADVMVVPSRQEAFGQSASEAHACGTPVVAFRPGGLTDIVDARGTGVPRRGERLWDPARVAGLSAEVYRQGMGRARGDGCEGLNNLCCPPNA